MSLLLVSKSYSSSTFLSTATSFLPFQRHAVFKDPRPLSKIRSTSLSKGVATPPLNMAIITPFMMVVTPQVQPSNTEIETECTTSSKEGSSQLLDAFLKSCTGIAPTHLEPANAVPSKAFNSTVLTLPLDIIKRIIRILLISPNPLILQHDSVTTLQDYRTYVEPNILQVSKLFHNIGVPILYGENTFTTSSPSTSFDFDEHLLSVPGSKRQLITSVKLEIDWADELWAKFPLVARALGELKALLKLELIIVEKEKEKVEQKKPTALIEKDVNLKIMIAYHQTSLGKDRSVHQRAPAADRADGQVKREGPVADAMLKAEIKMLRDLVTGIKGLKEFRLMGFRHEVFAWCLEEHVRMNNH